MAQGWCAASLHLSGQVEEGAREFEASVGSLGRVEKLAEDDLIQSRIRRLAEFLESQGIMDWATRYRALPKPQVGEEGGGAR